MENYDVLVPSEESTSNVGLTPAEIQSETQQILRAFESYDKEVQLIGTTITATLSAVNNAITSVTNTIQNGQMVKLEIAKLEAQLDKFIVESNNNVERFKSAMPVLDGQLNRISSQIDRIIDALLVTTTTSLDEKDLKRYSMQLEMLTSVKDSFNNILTKILTL